MILPERKLYIVQKYILAKSVADALKTEHKHNADNVFLDDKWRENNTKT